MQTYTQTFAVATTWKLNVPGKYYTTLACTLPINVRFYLGGKKLDLGDISGLLAGLEVGPLADLNGPNAFDRVEIDVQAGDTVSIGIGNGQARYNRASTSATITQNKAPQTGAIVHTKQNVTNVSGALLAANSARQYLLVQNQDATGNVFLKFAAAATADAASIKIPPGGNYEMNGVIATQALNAIGDVAANGNVLTVEG